MGDDAVKAYMVTWRYMSRPYLVDFDSETMAESFALLLAEADRVDVKLTGVEYEPDPEMAKRVWARIEERIRGEALA